MERRLNLNHTDVVIKIMIGQVAFQSFIILQQIYRYLQQIKKSKELLVFMGKADQNFTDYNKKMEPTFRLSATSTASGLLTKFATVTIMLLSSKKSTMVPEQEKRYVSPTINKSESLNHFKINKSRLKTRISNRSNWQSVKKSPVKDWSPTTEAPACKANLSTSQLAPFSVVLKSPVSEASKYGSHSGKF